MTSRSRSLLWWGSVAAVSALISHTPGLIPAVFLLAWLMRPGVEV